MEEIANQVFIEQSYPGVVSVVMKLKRGLLIIDGPCKSGDRQAWQQKLINLGGGIGQLNLMLDTHKDRLLSMPVVDAPVLAHENALEIIHDMPTASRPSDKQAGSDPEPHDFPQNNRWCLPDITYSHQVNLHWDDEPVVITHQPGGHLAGSWVRFDAEKVIFVGDSVMVNQPPYLTWSCIDRWIEELTWLNSDFFKHYHIISGRGGLVRQNSVVKMIEFLTAVNGQIKALIRLEDPDDEIGQCVPGLLKHFRVEREMKELYQDRLTWELKMLLKRIRLEDFKGEINAAT